jgi:transposase, IS5 family
LRTDLARVRAVTDADLFGTTSELVGAGVSTARRPRLPIRLMVALLYLRHAYNESDESVVQRWAQDVYFQFFSGQEYFEPRLPCDDSQIGRFRQVLGEAGVEQLLKTTIEAAVELKVVKRSEFERVIVDTTVQEKAVAPPSDSRLLEVARARIAQLATRAGFSMKQTYAAEGQQLRRRTGGYAHAKQFKRLRRVLRRLRVILGRLLRDIERKMTDASQAGLKIWIERAWRIQRQRPHDSNELYALHAPEVECISKVRREVAHIIVSPAHKVGDETGRSVGRSLPVHALLATAACEATGTTYRALGPRRLPRGNGVTCQHRGGWDARLSGMVNSSELLQASLCMTSQRC